LILSSGSSISLGYVATNALVQLSGALLWAISVTST